MRVDERRWRVPATRYHLRHWRSGNELMANKEGQEPGDRGQPIMSIQFILSSLEWFHSSMVLRSMAAKDEIPWSRR